jgi:glycosyltransferase involved in cell wall biosynthesis
MSGARTASEGRPAEPKCVVMTTRYPLDHPGGVESVARALVDRLGGSDERWQVSHIAAYSRRAGAARIPLLGDLVAAGCLAAKIIGTGDVILVHGAEYAWAPLTVGRLTRRPVVAVWHGVRAGEAVPPARRPIGKAARRFFLWIESRLERAALRADATVTVSPAVALELQSRYGVKGEPKVIPNGVARRTTPRTGDRCEEARNPAAPDNSPLRVIWVGTCAYKKGLDLAIEACELARARGQEMSLTVAGLQVESAGLEPAPDRDWLTWLGPVPPGEMDVLYRRHDILLFPSRYEACPMAVLEALAAGLPVVGSSVVQWLIEGAGEVVFGTDAVAYAEALMALAEPECRRRLTSAALERAQVFSWESSVAGYLEVLDVIGRQRGRQYRHRRNHYTNDLPGGFDQ